MTRIILTLLPALLRVLDAETMRRFMDAGLDAVEDAIARSETKVDDTLALPIIATFREAAKIPDDDVPAVPRAHLR